MAPRLAAHNKLFGDAERPVIGIGICIAPCDGPLWTTTDDPDQTVDAQDLHVMEKGDLMVRVRHTDQSGWAMGTLIRGDQSFRNLWYPPTYIASLRRSHFPGVLDFEHHLLHELWRRR